MTRMTELQLQLTRARLEGREMARASVKPKPDSPAVAMLWETLQRFGGWSREHAFHELRAWRFDFAHLELLVAVEVEGGVGMMGRHQRPEGFVADLAKYNQAALAGWMLLRFDSAAIAHGEATELILQAVRIRRAAAQSRVSDRCFSTLPTAVQQESD